MDTPDRSRRAVLRAGSAALLGGIAGCASGGRGSRTEGGELSATEEQEPTTTGTTATGTDTTATAWRSAELTDVSTDETFTVEEFEGRPVLLEFFAVWCPICTEQQQQIGTVLDEVEDLVAISLNVDPNEDATRVREHVKKYGFDWRYAIAPPPMTKALIEEFGSVITNPPAAPVIRICPDGAATLIDGRGVKGEQTLRNAFEQC